MIDADSPAEVLRRAAELMRKQAGAASDGPWKSWQEGRDHWGGDSMIGTEDPDGGDIYVQVAQSGYHPKWEADQDYIAGMHPLVGVALADLLDRFAGCDCDEDGDHWPEKAAALAVARAFLGEAAP